MIVLEGKTVFHKFWHFLRKYILTIKRFDLFLQGTLLVILLLRFNALLLIRRDAGTGQLPSLLEEWVLVGAAIVEFAFGTLLAWVGRGRKHLSLSACLASTALSGLLVLAFPFKISGATGVELCGGDTISTYSNNILIKNDNDNIIDNLAPYRMAFLILTVVMCSLSMVSVWAHGLTYLDDHEPQNGPYYFGILISIRLSLGLSGQNWLRPGALRDDWWEAHLSLSMLVLMFAMLFTFFPKKMPQWVRIDETDDTGFIASLLRIMRNKVITLQILALSLLNAGLFGFVDYDNAYVQARFHIEAVWSDPRTSRVVSDIFRALVVIFFVMIFRVRFSNRRSDGVKAKTAARVGGVVAIFVAIFFAVIAILNCGIDDIAGLEGGQWKQPQCSWECGCNSAQYGFTPVCVIDTGITHFSPCNAGCSQYENLNGLLLFDNCTCGAERVVRGSCSLPSCQAAFTAYQIVYTVTVAISAASMLMQGMVILRAVPRWDKPIAQGLAISSITVLAHFPGHILYFIISNLTCAYAGENGVGCIFHRPSLLWAPVTSAILAFFSAVLSLISSKVRLDLGGGIVTLRSTENVSN